MKVTEEVTEGLRVHRLFPVFLLDLIDPPERNPESGGKITRLTTGTQLIQNKLVPVFCIILRRGDIQEPNPVFPYFFE